MRNMVRVWVEIVRDIGVTSEFPQIHEAGRLVHEVTKDGQMYITAYKASWVRDNVKDIIQDGTIVCWVDDWPNSPSKVLELSKVAALHPSWIQSQS